MTNALPRTITTTRVTIITIKTTNKGPEDTKLLWTLVESLSKYEPLKLESLCSSDIVPVLRWTLSSLKILSRSTLEMITQQVTRSSAQQPLILWNILTTLLETERLCPGKVPGRDRQRRSLRCGQDAPDSAARVQVIRLLTKLPVTCYFDPRCYFYLSARSVEIKQWTAVTL